VRHDRNGGKLGLRWYHFKVVRACTVHDTRFPGAKNTSEIAYAQATGTDTEEEIGGLSDCALLPLYRF